MKPAALLLLVLSACALQFFRRPCRPACCPSETLTLYRFDGTAYRKVGERSEEHACSKLDF